MVRVSIVIITKNEAALIAGCIKMAGLITDDIIVIDNDSTDDTRQIALNNGCRVYRQSWNGYGANKNIGIALARHNWILSIDADEIPDMELISALQEVDLTDENTVYDIRFRSYFGKKLIRFGNWGNDHHLRLFNRKQIRWSEAEVHETLVLPPHIKIQKLSGHLHHYSVNDAHDFNRKAIHYARLSAGKYLKNGKKATFLKLHVSPVFGFIKNYIIRLGFLDGAAGLDIALIIFKNTKLKYLYLKQYQRGKQITGAKTDINKNFAVEY